ncbi:MAG TPA: PEGA domain-containing protein [Kofleriaceae bacterium]|nr:PEGA domain-containing protein [Kofleriaceae bacterium]
MRLHAAVLVLALVGIARSAAADPPSGYKCGPGGRAGTGDCKCPGGKVASRDADNWAVCTPKPPPAATACLAAHKGKHNVVVDATPQDGTLYIGDKTCGAVGKIPWRGKLAPGPVQIIVERQGYEPLAKEIVVDRRYKQTFSVVLVRTNAGTLEVRADADKNVTGAAVTVDGKPVGSAPLSTVLPGGTHQVVVTQTGFDPFTQSVDIRDSLSVSVLPILRPMTVARGKLVVTSDADGSEVFVDGTSRGAPPVVLADIAPGSHTVEVRRPSATTWKQTVTVTANQQTLVQAQLAGTIPKTGKVRITSKVAGARAFVDGAEVGATPVEVELGPGDHFVEVKAAGYRQRTERFTIAGGDTLAVDLDPDKDVATTGKLRIFSAIDGATVSIDGKLVGKAPVQLDLAPGTHTIVLERAGYKRYETKVELAVGETQTVRAAMSK